MRVLILGISGFGGSHLASQLLLAGAEVHGTARKPDRAERLDSIRESLTLHPLDLDRPEGLDAILDLVKPEAVYHLAGISFPPEAEERPLDALRVNTEATCALLIAVSRRRDKPPVVIASSAAVYGPPADPEKPISEDAPLAPHGVYAATKAASEWMAIGLSQRHGPSVYIVRPFNYTGPGQDSRFVCSEFARRIAEAELCGGEPVLRVGEPKIRRDFSDVRDAVSAMRAVADKGRPGEPYNVCSGKAVSVGEIAEMLAREARVPIEVRADHAKEVRRDVPVLMGDNSKIHGDTGWGPKIPIEITLRDLLDDWRLRLRASP